MLRWKRLFVFKRAVTSDSNRKYRLFDQGKNSFYQTFSKMHSSFIITEENDRIALYLKYSLRLHTLAKPGEFWL